MDEKINLLEQKFKSISKMGYVKSVNSGRGSIGTTFESLLGITPNELEIPDFNGIEIKTRRSYSKSYVTLFTSVPDGESFFEAKRIKDTYGYPDPILRNEKILNGSVYANCISKIGLNYYYKLKVDRNCKKVVLHILDRNLNIIENKVSWSFELLEEKLYRKLKVLALINAWTTKRNDITYYKYYKINFYLLKDFESFLTLLEKGIIRITFKLGVFRSGKRIGQMHDHGTGFEIKEEDLLKLYTLYK